MTEFAVLSESYTTSMFVGHDFFVGILFDKQIHRYK